MLRVAAARLAPSLRAGASPALPRALSRGLASRVHAIQNDKEYQDTLSATPGLAVVDFTATWCGPCKRIAPIFEQLAEENEDVTFLKVDIDTEELQGTVAAAGISSVPTFNFVRGGELVGQVLGADAPQITRLVAALKA